MAEAEIQRVNFFDGQFLKQAEFLDLDAYHLHMRRRWAYALFNQSGVIQATAADLTVQVENLAQKKIRVKAGMAIGKRDDLAEAKEIVLREDQIIDLRAEQLSLQNGDTAIIAIQYQEEPVANPPSEGDTPGNTRIKEHAILSIFRNALPAPSGEPLVRLADVDFQQMTIKTTQRQTALINTGLVGAQPQPQTPTITGIIPAQLSQGTNNAKVTTGVVKKICDGALAGDLNCVKMFLYLLPRPPRFNPMPIDLPPATSATEALNQIAIIVSRMLAGSLDLDTAHSAINGLKAYIVGISGSEFEAKLKRYEALIKEPSAIFGDAPQANGHDPSEIQLHNGHDVSYGTTNGNGAEGNTA
jgi:hypothetical protein